MGNHNITLNDNKPTNNERMVDILVERHCYISSQKVEAAFRAVDRAMYYDIEEGEFTNPYSDDPWRRGNLHLSAPCIYAKVVEALNLSHGLSFLNLGSGTGYLNTVVGLLIGPHGVNHGVEFYANVVDYAYDRLETFKQRSHAIDKYDFAEPIFIKGNCLNLNTNLEYDRIYLGASCLPTMESFVKKLIKPGGGILVMPFENHLIRHTRISADQWESEELMDVNFTEMIGRDETDTKMIDMPLSQAKSLRELCRIAIRQQMRRKIDSMNPDLLHSDNIEYRRERARAHEAAMQNKESLKRLQRLKRAEYRDGRYSCCCKQQDRDAESGAHTVNSSINLNKTDRVITRSASRLQRSSRTAQQMPNNDQSPMMAPSSSSTEAGVCSGSGSLSGTSRRRTQSAVIDDDNIFSSDSDDHVDKVDCAGGKSINDRCRSDILRPETKTISSQRIESIELGASSSSLNSTDESIDIDPADEPEHWRAGPNPNSPPLFWEDEEAEDGSSSLSDDEEEELEGRIYAIRFENDLNEGIFIDEDSDGDDDSDDEDEDDDDDYVSPEEEEAEVGAVQLSSGSSSSIASQSGGAVEVSVMSAMEAVDDLGSCLDDGDDNLAKSNSRSILCKKERPTYSSSSATNQEQPVASRLRSKCSLQNDSIGTKPSPAMGRNREETGSEQQGIGPTISSSISTRPTNDRSNSSPSASSRVAFRPITRRSVWPGHHRNSGGIGHLFRTPIEQRMARIAQIQQQSLQQPISWSVHRRKRPHSSSSESSDAPAARVERRQCGRYSSGRMKTRLSNCICKRTHCSKNNSSTSGLSANDVSEGAPLQRQPRASAKSGDQNNPDDYDNGKLLHHPRQGSSSSSTSSCSPPSNISTANKLKYARARVNRTFGQGDTSMASDDGDGDEQRFGQNETKQECSPNQNDIIIPSTTKRATRSSFGRGPTSAASLMLPSAASTILDGCDRALRAHHREQLQTNSPRSAAAATTRACCERSKMARSTTTTQPASSSQQERSSTMGDCKSRVIKKGGGGLANSCGQTHHQRNHNHHHQQHQEHNHKCRHNPSHSYRRRHHHHHCRHHQHEHHRCHHQRQPQPRQLPSDHNGIYLCRNHRQSQQQRASKRLGDPARSGNVWQRVEALRRDRVEAAARVAEELGKRRCCRSRRGELGSKRKSENECEKYHNHMCSHISRLPLPKVLLSYLNYDRLL